MYLIDDVLNMWCYVMLIPVRFGPNNKHIILFVKGIFALSYKNNTASGKNQAAPTAGNFVWPMKSYKLLQQIQCWEKSCLHKSWCLICVVVGCWSMERLHLYWRITLARSTRSTSSTRETFSSVPISGQTFLLHSAGARINYSDRTSRTKTVQLSFTSLVTSVFGGVPVVLSKNHSYG